MRVPVIIVLIGFGLVTAVAAQGTPSGKSASSPAPSKSQLSEVRSIVHELQARTEKLRDLMEQYRSLVEQRPQPEGGSPEAKKAHDQQLERWSMAVDRLMRRVEGARAAVVETTQRLDVSVAGQLPTSLAKDVANARNDAEAQRTAAEQALAKNKPARSSKRAKQAPTSEPPAPPIPDDL